MVNIIEVKEKFDKNQVDVSELSTEEIIVLCGMYEEQIEEIEGRIQDLDNQISSKKNEIRRNLDIIRELNNKGIQE